MKERANERMCACGAHEAEASSAERANERAVQADGGANGTVLPTSISWSFYPMWDGANGVDRMQVMGRGGEERRRGEASGPECPRIPS